MDNKIINDLLALDLNKGWAKDVFLQYQRSICEVLPNTLPWRLESYFRDTLFFQRLAFIQQAQSNYKLDTLPPELSVSPSVILTAHLFSYRAVIRYLAESGLKLVLLVSETVFKNQKVIFEQIIKGLADTPLEERFILLNAESSTVLFRAKRAFDRGFHIVAYIDGNTGACAGSKINTNLVPIQFGNTQLRVRQGVVQLAEWLQCNLYALWPQMDANMQTSFILKEYNTSNDTATRIQDVYADLYELIEAYPAQWECFLYLKELT